MKRIIGLKKNGRRWRVGIWLMPALLVSSFGGCSTASTPKTDDRPCWVGILDGETAMLLRASRQWEVKAGDLIQTPTCAREESEALLNSVYHATR